jgi:hypothetical protein
MCDSAAIFKAMALASTPCPIYSIATGKLLVGREGYLAMRDDPHTYVIGYAEDQAFWDAFLLMHEELPDVVAEQNSGPTLSERFRRTRRANDDGTSGVGADNP